MKSIVMVVMAAGTLIAAEARGQKPPLLAEKEVAALANEMSGEAAKGNLEGIARFHRQRGSQGFHEAAELVAERLRAYGLNDVEILQFPADGKIFYGTQRSRPAWDAEFGKLSEIASDADRCNKAIRDSEKKEKEEPQKLHSFNCVSGLNDGKTIASYEAVPVALAEDSESAEVNAELVEVGEGTKESDYAGKDVNGKIVLVAAQPGAVQDLAVGKYGAAGIVSYAQNQKTAWSGENLDAIRWGHLETFSANKTFAFMVSLRTARMLQARLASGEAIKLHAVVKAGQHPGNYEVVTATIPGADAKLKEEEIVFSCHLDHQRPGANDNASGCAAILEVARTLQKLVAEKKLERPGRTIRFVFPPEVEGTLALLNGNPELAKRIKAVVHMDMVGGGPETKAVFHVTRGPMSLPSFVHDVAWAFAEWVNQESYEFAATGKAEYPLVTPGGGREPLRGEYSAYSMGSDHDVYQDSSFKIPVIYMNDWPDRFIHTNFDSGANIDPTKLKRAAFIGAASGYFLARMEDGNAVAVMMRPHQYEWSEKAIRRSMQLEQPEAEKYMDQVFDYEEAVFRSINLFATLPMRDSMSPPFQRPKPTPIYVLHADKGTTVIWKRRRQPSGPLAVFGYDYFETEWAKRGHRTRPKLLEYSGLWGGGEEYSYEVLNFANGKRNAEEIRDAVSAEYGPVPLELVMEYLTALEEIGVVEGMK